MATNLNQAFKQSSFLTSPAGGMAISAGSDIIGSLLSWWGNKGNVKRANQSIDDMQGQIGTPILDVESLISKNRQDLFGGQSRRMLNETARRRNIDQPRAEQHFLNMMFDREAGMRPQMVEREAYTRSSRDTQIRQAIAQLRARMAGA